MSVHMYERKKRLMAVQTKAAELLSYTALRVSDEKCLAMRNRWSIGDRTLGFAIDAAAWLDSANRLSLDDPQERKERRSAQRSSMMALHRLMVCIDTIAELKPIGDSYAYWTTLVDDTLNLLDKWMKSDAAR